MTEISVPCSAYECSVRTTVPPEPRTSADGVPIISVQVSFFQRESKWDGESSLATAAAATQLAMMRKLVHQRVHRCIHLQRKTSGLRGSRFEWVSTAFLVTADRCALMCATHAAIWQPSEFSPHENLPLQRGKSLRRRSTPVQHSPSTGIKRRLRTSPHKVTVKGGSWSPPTSLCTLRRIQQKMKSLWRSLFLWRCLIPVEG